MSKKYESGNRGAGTIGNNAGDWGGKSYGTYQIATNTGTMNSFLKFLKSYSPSMYSQLSKYSIGSSGFDRAWKSLASNNGASFEKVQHEFIKRSHYDPVVSKVKSGLGIDVNKMSPALQNVIWSLGVQHGSAGAYNLIKNAGVRIPMNEETMIRRIYAERMKVDKYFSRSSAAVKRSVYNRFQRELQDALKMLR